MKTVKVKILQIRSRLSGISSGFLDSGFSSISTFAVGFYAVRTLPDDELALYSVLMTTFVMCMIIPQQLYFFPTRISINLATAHLAPHLRRDLWQALPTLILASLLVFLSGGPLFSGVEPLHYVLLAGTAAIATAAGAVQGHMRGCLHILGKHGAAAAMSVTNAALSVSAVVVISLTVKDSSIAPLLSFGVLAVAYTASMFWWLISTAGVPRPRNNVSQSLRTRILYMIPDLSTQAVVYVMSLIVVALLGASALADLEAARLAASPVFILAAGLASSLVPAALRLLSHSEASTVSRTLLRLKALILFPSAIYAACLAVSGPLLTWLFDRDANSSLSASRAAAFGLEGASNTLSSFFVGINRTVAGVLIALVTSTISILVLLPALYIVGVYAHPLAQGVGALVKSVWGMHYIRKHITTASLSEAPLSR